MDYLAGEIPEQDMAGLVLIAYAAALAGQDLTAWPPSDPLAPKLDPEDSSLSLGSQARMLHAMAAGGVPEAQWATLLRTVEDSHDGVQFGAANSVVDDAWIISALLAAGMDAGDERIASSVQELIKSQGRDGGWRHDRTWPSEPDETGFVLRALAGAGAISPEVSSAARTFLVEEMNDDGSYPYQRGTSCTSSGLALLAWTSLGEDAPPLTRQYLLQECRNADGGFAAHQGHPSSVWSTADIISGLAASS